jgi:hypothetical protein
VGTGLELIGLGTCDVEGSIVAGGGFPATTVNYSFGTNPGLDVRKTESGPRIAGSTLAAGDEFVVTGAGLEPGSTVSVELHSSPVVLSTAIVGLGGTVLVPVKIPLDTLAGSHTVVAFGVSGTDGTTVLTRSAPIEVTSSGLAAAALAGTGIALALVPLLLSIALLLVAGATLLLSGRLGVFRLRRRRSLHEDAVAAESLAS